MENISFYKRIFSPAETKSITLYNFDDDDTFSIDPTITSIKIIKDPKKKVDIK